MKYGKGMKEGIKLAVAVVYAGWLFATQKQPRTVIIYYHAVSAEDKISFARQINYLAKHYKVVKLSEILPSVHRYRRNAVAITFDDAFENLFENAIPILAERLMPAVIFAPAGNLGEMPRWDILPDCKESREKVMSREQLIEADTTLTEIHSHTMTHARLTEISPDALWDELIDSKKELEKILGHPVRAISYPHGSCDKAVFEMSQKAGYEYGFTIEPETVTSQNDKMALPRVSVSPKDSLFVFKLKLRGAYGYSKVVKTVKSQVQAKLRCLGCFSHDC